MAEAGAAYYNVQLFRNGKEVWSSWPQSTTELVPAAWRLDGKPLALAPGRYTWFVWPGFGTLSEVKYGHLLGESSFLLDDMLAEEQKARDRRRGAALLLANVELGRPSDPIRRHLIRQESASLSERKGAGPGP